MNAFPYLAVFTICISFAVLRASFDDLREAPLALATAAAQERVATARKLRLAGALRSTPVSSVRPKPLWRGQEPLRGADEGLLDHELASADPIDAWLDRYLTPPAQ